MRPYLLSPSSDAPFPHAENAMTQPDGLLAVGGDLTPQRLLNAYTGGIFPWFSEGQPILWWSPDPRAVFRTEAVRLSSRFRRELRRNHWHVCADTCFAAVVEACADVPRPGQDGTWITPQMREAYLALHRLGYAHSVEVFDGQTLVGGIYGVAIGQVFFGESMFSGRSGGSKAALGALAACLRRWGWPLIDAQVENPHLLSLGAELWPRHQFLASLRGLICQPAVIGNWTERFGNLPAATLSHSVES